MQRIFASTIGSFTRLFMWWLPESVLTEKFQQANSSGEPVHTRLEGSISTCKVDQFGKVLTKTVRLDRRETFMLHVRILGLVPMAHVLNSWASCARNEFDMNIERGFQQKFYEAWKNDPCIIVPRVIRSDSISISMQYVCWPRWIDVYNTDKGLARKSISLVARFFFESISNHHLLYGDISPYNILICPGPGDELCICVVDYGLCREMDHDSKKSLTEFDVAGNVSAQTLSNNWSVGGNIFNEIFWTDLQSHLLESPFSDIDGVFVRSLLGLTHMACMVEFITDKPYII